MDSNPLGLFIPAQNITIVDSPYFKVREAETWIEELPTAHVGETARLIFKAMAEINRTPMPIAQRFKLLELFRKPFDYVSESLVKHYLGQSFPLSPKNQKISELTRELQSELAIGYKIIINESLSKSNSRIDKKLLRTSIYRAMHYLGQRLYKSYLVYQPPSGQIWLEIHHLYLFSEHNDLTSDIVKDNLHPKLGSNTISALYKQIVLLSLANPYRFPQSEIRKINEKLRRWARYSKLQKLNNPHDPAGMFSIDLEHNTAPSYFNASPGVINSEFIRILDTSELTRALRDQIENSYNNESSENISTINQYEVAKETLKRLILAWGSIPKRNFARKGTKDRVKVALGVSATHNFIQKKDNELGLEQARLSGEDFNNQGVVFSERAEFMSVPVKKIGESGNQPDIWDIAHNPNMKSKKPTNNGFASIEEFQSSSSFLQIEDNLYETYDCVSLNSSDGGYCISWENATTTKISVGSLIAITNNEFNEEEAWAIGVVRWIKIVDNNIMHIGIELISPSAQAVAAKNVTQKNGKTDYTRCLLLPELRAIKQPQTIITQSLFKTDDKVELDVHGQTIKVKLTKEIKNTGTFNQFLFSIIKTAKKAPKVDNIDHVDKFDSIWSSI